MSMTTLLNKIRKRMRKEVSEMGELLHVRN